MEPVNPHKSNENESNDNLDYLYIFSKMSCILGGFSILCSLLWLISHRNIGHLLVYIALSCFSVIFGFVSVNRAHKLGLLGIIIGMVGICLALYINAVYGLYGLDGIVNTKSLDTLFR